MHLKTINDIRHKSKLDVLLWSWLAAIIVIINYWALAVYIDDALLFRLLQNYLTDGIGRLLRILHYQVPGNLPHAPSA